ncbi:MAG: hypothetical protein P4M04_10060 [Acidobacteriota bacterium]|nr:hypothetical protein [Acidobacteriota bacterium]
MNNSRRKAAIRLLPILGVMVLAVTSWAQQRPPIVEQMAKTYGLDSFGQIEAIRYTFNLSFPGVTLSRTWTWEPKTGQVTYEAKDKSGKPVKVTYLRSELSSQPAEVKDDIDPGFINDNYWFLLPFHIYWDTGATVDNAGMQKLPVGQGSADKVVVKYPSDVGYTPGDTWELYVGKDNRIEQMVYHRGGPKKPSLVIATWAGYKKAGSLLVSTEHRGTADGGALHLTFSNVAVKLVGSDTWMDAK